MPEPTPIDTALWRATSVWSRHDRSVICDEVDRLRGEADIASINLKANDAELRRLRAEVAKLRPVAFATAWTHGPVEIDALIAEVRRLRSLLARCVDHIDPNDSDDAFRLLVECEEASRG